jgi:hypothetical protein
MITTALPVRAFTVAQTATITTFTANADAQVNEANPSSNYGNSTYLQVDGDAGIRQETYIKFSVSGLSGAVSNAKVRVYDTTNGSNNGPILYGTGTSWIETGITWSNRPAQTTGSLGNLGAVSAATWVEYDVTSQVIADGTYSFVLVADSNDGLTFSSRQGSYPAQLVVTTGTSSTPVATLPASTVVPTSTIAATSTVAPIPTITSQPSTNSVVLVGAGDISSCSNTGDEQTARLLDAIPGTVFTVGDNAYTAGTAAQFNDCYDPTWGRHKSRTMPVPGNHEYNTAGASGYFGYFNVPSYYAYDLGAWRIYALNSQIDVSATSEQLQWLQADLAANPRQCVLAYWHEPRWSSGKHGSNVEVQELWKTLYDAGADVVLNGHDHDYERFTQMNASGSAVASGMREFVVGMGGAGFYSFVNILPTSQVRNANTFGVLKLTLSSSSYSWQFVPVAGKTFTDSGTTNCR